MRAFRIVLAAVAVCALLNAASAYAAEDRDPGVKNKHFRSAVDLIRNKEYAAAKTLLGLALKDHPDSMASLRATGYCCMKLGQLEEATALYKKVVAIGEKLKDTTGKERERIDVAKKRLKELAALAPKEKGPGPTEPKPTKKEPPKQKQYTLRELQRTFPGDYVWFMNGRKLGTITLLPNHRIRHLRGQPKGLHWSVRGNELVLNRQFSRVVLNTVVRPGVYEGTFDGDLIRIEKVGGVDLAALAPRDGFTSIPADAMQFGDHYYKAYTPHVSWQEAKRRCEAAGGYLACVESKEENDFLKTITQSKLCFLGGTDAATEGEWNWINGKPFIFMNWAGREPNNKRGTEHYVCLVSNGQWVDKSAPGPGVRGYICEWGTPPSFKKLGDDLAGAYYWYEDGTRRGKLVLGKGGTIESFLGKRMAGAKWIVVGKNRLDLKLGGRTTTISSIARPGMYEGARGGKKVTLLLASTGGRKATDGTMAFPVSMSTAAHELGKSECHVSYGSAYKSVLLLQGNTLRVLDRDGVKLVKTVTLPAQYKKLFDRKAYWVALSDKSLDLVSKSTRKVIRTIRFETKGFLDLALHPSLPVSYVTAIDPKYQNGVDPLSRRLYVIDEAKGSATLPPHVYAQWLAVDPKGRYLYSSLGYSVRTQGGRWGWEQYTDLLVSYDVRSGWPKPLHTNHAPGGNGQCLRVAPNGSSVSYVAANGYREGRYSQGHYIPAFDAKNIRRATAAFPTKSYPREMCYHPKLDLVIATCREPRFFDLRTSRPLTSRIDFGGRQFGAWGRFTFSPGGKHVLLECRDRSDSRKLYSMPLFLTDKEIARLAGKPARPRIDKTVASKVPKAWGPKRIPAYKLTALSGGSTKKMSVQTIAKRYKNAVVIIKGPSGSGTGFVIGTDGYILTCAHVLPVFGNVTVVYNLKKDGDIIKVSASATILEMDKKRDIALIKIKPKGKLTSVHLEQVTKPSMGEAVSIIGHPGLGTKLLEYTMTTGIVSNANQTIEGQSYIQTNAAVNRGSSGGPVFNSRGNVIGVVVLKAHIEAAGFAVPKSAISKFLRSVTKKR